MVKKITDDAMEEDSDGVKRATKRARDSSPEVSTSKKKKNAKKKARTKSVDGPDTLPGMIVSWDDPVHSTSIEC